MGNLSIGNVLVNEWGRILPGHTGPVQIVAWHPEENRIASGGNDRTVRLGNTENGDELFILRDYQAVVRDFA